MCVWGAGRAGGQAVRPSSGSLTPCATVMAVGLVQTGYLPSGLGSLPHLLRLVLSDNFFEGDIPAAWGNLTNVTDLGLGSAGLSGATAVREHVVHVGGKAGSFWCGVCARVRASQRGRWVRVGRAWHERPRERLARV